VVQGVTQETPNVADATIETKIPIEPIPEPASEPPALYEYDVAVIGGGPAGYTAAIRAAELGAKVILFEMDEIGGTDLYRGRIQTKAYCKMGERTREIQKAVDRGITVPQELLDIKRCVTSTEALVAAMAADIRNRLAESAVTVVNTRAALKSEHEIFSGAGAFTADKVILCGGRTPLVPALPGIDHAGILTSDEIFRLKTLPKRLLVLGGGSIGCQIAAVFSAFGCKVILVEKQPRILPDTNPKISSKVAASLTASGVKLVTGVTVFGVSDAGGLPCAETVTGGIECDLLFLATGRKPNLLGLGLLADRIAQENGAVKVNAAMQTNIPNIYAAGDIVSGAQRITGVLEKARVAAERAFLI
jgi:dihydrolipoamide dehydrogenase